MKPVVLVLASLLSVPSLADPVWLHYRNREASDVFVAGEFNNWDKTADRLTQGEDGLWTLEKDLPAGTYGYKLVVDENWIFDPENPARKEVGGVENSMLDTADPFFSKPVDLSVSRTWTSRSGAQLEARLVEFTDGTAVLEKADGKRVRIAATALSEADQRLLEAGAPKPEAEPAAAVTPAAAPGTPAAAGTTATKGLIDNYALTVRMYEKPSDYFKGPTRRNMQRFYTNQDRLDGEFRKGAYDPVEPIEYDVAAESASVYVPDTYDGTTNWGLFVHVDPGDGPTIKDDWKEVMAKHRLLYACARDAENGKPDMRRVGLALDTIATVRKDYVINSNRVIVSGLSDGGRIAYHAALLYPECFRGAISHAAQIYINGHYPYMTIPEFMKVARKPMRWAVVSGDEDKNYKEIIAASKKWRELKFDYRFFDVPGMGHVVASGEWLDKILGWVEGEEVEGAEPREE